MSSSKSQTHIRGVEASGGGLVGATVGAALAAGSLLVLMWLPAEYGVDLTGFGRKIGLTEMGEIKQQLADEAEAEAATDPQVLARLAEIESQLAALNAKLAGGAAPMSEVPEAPGSDGWRDTWTYTLQPDQGIEAKMEMLKGQTAQFEWRAEGGSLNYDMHGDGAGGEISYDKNRNKTARSGALTAAFEGMHGWYWRNRSDVPVTLTLNLSGDYEYLATP